MNKDEIQEIKALNKMNCVKEIIDALQTLNLLENSKDMKQYDIVLDYEKNDRNSYTDEEFTIFKITIYYKRPDISKFKETKMFDFNFKLKDEATGFAIFKSIREYFLEKNDLQYSVFRPTENREFKKDNNQVPSNKWHKIVTNHNVNLVSMIHSKKDEKKLESFHDKIYDEYKMFKKVFNTTDKSKDEIQELKAEEKTNIILSIIDTISKLGNSNVDNDQHYDIVLDYRDFKDKEYTEFSAKVLKNRSNIIFDLNFKLKNKELGIELFDKIAKHFVKINNRSIKCFGDKQSYDLRNEDTTHFISAYGMDLVYKTPQKIFDKLCEQEEEKMYIK